MNIGLREVARAHRREFLKPCVHGFRALAFGQPRNDKTAVCRSRVDK
jgi:hypothetical protein